jgi:phosphoglycolate phosphatase
VVKLVIFDCDGTLVDSQHIIVAAMNEAMVVHDLPPLPAPQVLSIVGISLPLAVERLLPAASPAAIEAVTQGYKDAFGRLRRDPAHHEPLYPGILGLIHALSAREDVLLGVATGKSVRGVNALFDRMDLHHHFFTIQTADTHPSKPHPSMIEISLAEAGVGPGDAVMIGDTTYDIEMACNAAVAGIGVSWGYHDTDALHRAGARSIVADAAELHDSVLDILGLMPDRTPKPA